MMLRALRHYALVSEMVGVEGIVTAEQALMIVNLQSLGLSVALTSVPIIASAMTSLVLIPLLGYIEARCAKTAKQKAFSLISINLLQILGVGFIILGNILRLVEDQSLQHTSTDFSSMTSTFDQHPNTTESPSSSSAHSSIRLISTTTGNRTTWSNSSSSGIRGNSTTSISSLEDIVEDVQGSSNDVGGLKFYTIFAMIGYIMSDSGYDTGSCFLKTFAMSATSSRDHPDVIVRAIQMSSVGGILVTLLASVGVGEMMAEGTGLNVNSVTTTFIFAVMILIILPTAILTLTTGLCCRGGLYGQGGEDVEERSNNYEGTKAEKQSLISESMASSTSSGFDDKTNKWQVSFSSVRNDDDTNIHTRHPMISHQSWQSSSNRDFMEKIFQLSQSGAHSLIEEELNNANMKSLRNENYGLDYPGCFGKMRRFFKQQEKRVILCMASFFAMGALFSFNAYSVNFVTVSVCGGDLNAPPGSEKYDNYLRGIKIGSTGLLIFYASFVVGTTVQEFLLRRIGWWRETSIMLVLYIISNITSAVVKLEAFYYVSAFVSGLNRAMVFTVPYILVCRLLTDNKSDSSKSNSKSENTGDIALVAAMLPLGMSLYSSAIGPLMEITGDTATPIYFSGIGAFIALILFSLLGKY